MKLCLVVVSKDRYFIDQVEFCFDQIGGTIGRSSTCDWIIQDVNRYISSVHLEIRYHDQAYYVMDRSTNGTFRGFHRISSHIEDQDPLADGEILLLGELKIQVDLRICSKSPDVTQIVKGQPILPPDKMTEHNGDQAAILDQQARLADMIGQAFHGVDHGAELGWQSVSAAPQTVDDSNVNDVLTDVLELLLVATQKKCAEDRILNPKNHHLLASDHPFRVADSVKALNIAVMTTTQRRQLVQSVLDYLVSRS